MLDAGHMATDCSLYFSMLRNFTIKIKNKLFLNKQLKGLPVMLGMSPVESVNGNRGAKNSREIYLVSPHDIFDH